MQKPQKNNYTLVKAYHPIVLLDTIRKTFGSILARKISAIIKIYYLLLGTHLSERRNTSTEYSIYYLVEKLYAAWDRNK